MDIQHYGSKSCLINGVKNVNKIYRLLKYIIGIIVIILLVVSAQYFINNTPYNNSKYMVSYYDKPEVDYRVHYIDNDFYNDEFIGSDKAYVASLVDYIDIDFDYHIGYSEEIDASSVYDIKATIIATDSKSHNVVWDSYKKNYLTKKEVKSNGNKGYYIKDSIRVNYKEFNDFLIDYRNKNHVNVDGYLLVEFYTKNNGTYEEIKNINTDNRIELHIPLNESQFKIEKYLEDKSDEFTYEEDNRDVKLRDLIIGGILWLVVIVLAAYLALSYRKDIMSESEYTRKLRKIISTYDGIIVNVDKLPSLEKLNVAEVTDFEELVDAQNEVRLPINFKEDKRRGIAKFVLIRNNLAWVYQLKEGEKREK